MIKYSQDNSNANQHFHCQFNYHYPPYFSPQGVSQKCHQFTITTTTNRGPQLHSIPVSPLFTPLRPSSVFTRPQRSIMSLRHNNNNSSKPLQRWQKLPQIFPSLPTDNNNYKLYTILIHFPSSLSRQDAFRVPPRHHHHQIMHC